LQIARGHCDVDAFAGGHATGGSSHLGILGALGGTAKDTKRRRFEVRS
jgi:hypothetical protein